MSELDDKNNNNNHNLPCNSLGLSQLLPVIKIKEEEEEEKKQEMNFLPTVKVKTEKSDIGGSFTKLVESKKDSKEKRKKRPPTGFPKGRRKKTHDHTSDDVVFFEDIKVPVLEEVQETTTFDFVPNSDNYEKVDEDMMQLKNIDKKIQIFIGLQILFNLGFLLCLK